MSVRRVLGSAVLLVLMSLGLGPGSLADSVQGAVYDETGVPVSGVAVALTGSLTGPQPNTLTDAAGLYSLSVPADTYTVIYTAVAGSGLVPQRFTAVVVAGSTLLADRILRFGVNVTGLVTDPLGAPVATVDLRFADRLTGETIYTPFDDTDAAGHYAAFVPPSNYKIEFRPPEQINLAPVALPAVEIQSGGALPTVVLPDGVVVIGTVLNEAGVAQADVDLDLIDTATGNKIFTTRDSTNAFGVYRTVVVPGVYDIHYLPPPQSGLVAQEIRDVQLPADVVLPDVTLLAGLEFAGRVVNDQAVGLAAVDLNVFDALSGEQLLTPGDDTDADGYYRLQLPPGNYDVRYTPPALPPYLPRRVDGISVTSNVTRPDVILDLGFLVSGVVVDPAAQPVADVDLDFKDTLTNSLIYTARDDSDLAGQFAVAVPGATYRIEFMPPVGSELLPRSLHDVLIDQDLDLGQIALSAPVSLQGIVQDGAGNPLAGIRFEIRDAATDVALTLPDDLTDATGLFAATVPPGTYRIYLEPPVGTTFFPLLTAPLLVDADVDLGIFTLPRGFVVSGVVTDSDGTALTGVIVRANQDVAGSPSVEALTDVVGRFEMLLSPGTYGIDYDPAGLPFLPLSIGPLVIDDDTMVPRAVLEHGWTVSGRAVDDASSGVGDVDVDLLDAVSGASIPLQGDLTDAAGFFAVKVGEGTYILRLQPDPASGFFEVETQAFTVVSHVDLGVLLLPRGVNVGGGVVDDSLAPVQGVGIELIPEPGSGNMGTVSTLTDAAGLFVAFVPQGDYRVRYDPPVASAFLVQQIGPLSLVSDTTLPPVVLETGRRVSGSVVDNLLTPAAGVDVDLLDAVSGQSIPLRGDLTGADGRFDVLAPIGTYLVRLEPDPLTRLLPLVTSPVVAEADVDIGELMLASGVLLSGDVVDEAAAAIAGVGIDLVGATSGLEAPLVGDRTNSQGAFTTAVVPGDYFVAYRPPLSTAYVAQQIGPVTVSGDTQLPTVTMRAGTPVSGVVLDPGLTPLVGVETEWRPAGTCDVVFTVRDSTDAAGRFEVALLPGVYDLTLIPPPASALFVERIPSVTVSADPVQLPTHTLSATEIPLEACNQLDDDCDGLTDETFSELGGACSAGAGACQAAGVLVCAADGTELTCDAVPGMPSVEVCDDIDNDCDGATDEGCATVDIAIVVEPGSLSWNAVSGAVNYDVLRGDLGVLRTSGFTAAVITCLADDTIATLVADGDEPPSGEAFWTLVRWNSAAGAGSYGDAQRDVQIAASPQACLP